MLLHGGHSRASAVLVWATRLRVPCAAACCRSHGCCAALLCWPSSSAASALCMHTCACTAHMHVHAPTCMHMHMHLCMHICATVHLHTLHRRYTIAKLKVAEPPRSLDPPACRALLRTLQESALERPMDYGLYSYGLYSYGCRSLRRGLWIMAYIVMAYIVMAAGVCGEAYAGAQPCSTAR